LLTPLAFGSGPPARSERDKAVAIYLKGHALWEQGKPEEAIPHVEQAVRLAPRAFGANDLQTADLHNRLGKLYYLTSQFAPAEAQFRHSLRIRDAKLGPNHLLVAESLNNLAIQFKEQGRYAEAEAPLRRSLAIQERATPDEPPVADALDNLAFLLQRLDRNAEATRLFTRALEIRRSKRGKQHVETAQSLRNIAEQLEHDGKVDDARKHYEESLRIWEATVGPTHRKVAIGLQDLATLHLRQGRPDDAIPLLERSLKIQRGNGGKEDPEVFIGGLLEKLAWAHGCRGDWPRAAASMDEAQRIYLRFVNYSLPAQPEAEQLTFLRTRFQRTLHRALSLGLSAGTDPALAAQSAAWVLNGKGVAHQALAERALLDRDRKDPATRQLAVQLDAVRAEQSRLMYQARSQEPQAARARRLAELAGKEEDLIKQLGERRGRARKGDTWVSLDSVRKALPEDAVLIEVARFARLSFKPGDRAAADEWYAAWIIPAAGKGDVRVVELGPAEEIDDAVWALRLALQKGLASVARMGEAKAEKQLLGPLEALSRRVVQPLLKHAGPARRWVISPDGELWLVPWAALRLGDGRYVVEGHEVRYAVSGRDLVARPSAAKPTAPLVLADPDFDLKPTPVKVAAGPKSARPGLRSGALGDTRWERLPGTAAEARAIGKALQRLAGTKPRILTGARATESAFKASTSPRVLVLSTHGFFLEDQAGPPVEQVAGTGWRGIVRVDQPVRRPRVKAPTGPLQNPLLRCGLVLAGANHPAEASGADDGVLTGLEIAAADLRGTELVVLSACETGLGQVHQGEGVSGLRQAFQLAGARAVAATLWKVADRETAQLVGAFFDQLARKRPPVEALRAAQLAMIRERRRENGAAHPYYWAAFTVTGR
jgi:CHAT domain-containing protein/Tfp pilus assembly protein PilF